MNRIIILARTAALGVKVFTFFVLLFVLMPLVTMLSDSFAGSNSQILSFPPQGFSFNWYSLLAADPEFLRGLQTSLLLGVTASVSSLLVALTLAVTLRRYPIRGSGILRSYALSPLIVPEVVIGLAMLQLFRTLGILGSFVSIFLAHVVIIMPYSLRILESTFFGVDVLLEDAAKTLGANEFQAFRYVTLQLIRPGLAASFILGFVVSFNDIAMTAFLTTPSLTTVSIVIFGWSTQLYTPLLAAASGSIMIATLLFLLLVDRVVGMDRVTALVAYR